MDDAPDTFDTTTAKPVDLARVAGSGGVVWSVSPEGFHANLVALRPNGSIPSHRNDAIDVLVVVVTGTGTAAIDDDEVGLAAASALLIPKGADRSITAGPGGLRYLTVHAQRGPMGIGPRR